MDTKEKFIDYYEVLGVWPTADADAIKKATDALMAEAQAIGKILYEEVAKQQAASGAAPPPPGDARERAGSSKDDDVIDAEFEVKDAK